MRWILPKARHAVCAREYSKVLVNSVISVFVSAKLNSMMLVGSSVVYKHCLWIPHLFIVVIASVCACDGCAWLQSVSVKLTDIFKQAYRKLAQMMVEEVGFLSAFQLRYMRGCKSVASNIWNLCIKFQLPLLNVNPCSNKWSKIVSWWVVVYVNYRMSRTQNLAFEEC